MTERRMTSYEREAMMKIAVANQCLADAEKNLKTRLGMIEGGLRDIRCAESKITRLMQDVVPTVPIEQARGYARALRDASYTVGTKCHATDHTGRISDEYGMYVSYAALEALVKGCRDRCMMCDLDGCERGKCELRKALNEIPNEAPVRDNDDDCPYYEVI